MPDKKAEVTLKTSSPNWNFTTNRFVGFIDIMGFRDLVMRSTHEEIYTMMKKIELATKTARSIYWTEMKDELVRSTFYSDSIILYSKDDSYESAYSMVATLSSLSNDLFSSAIPHKGAIAFGNMTLDTDRSIFFGQPLIDAYLLQEEVNFYGIVVHSSAELRFEQTNLQTDLSLFDFSCPFKGGTANHLTIPPLFGFGSLEEKFKEKADEFKSGFSKLKLKTSGHIRKYIDNTKAYHDQMAKQ